MSIMHHRKSGVHHPGWCTSTHLEDAPTDPIHDGAPEVLYVGRDWLVEVALSRQDQVVDGEMVAGQAGVQLTFTSTSMGTVPGPVSAAPFVTPADGARLLEVLAAKLAQAAVASR